MEGMKGVALAHFQNLSDEVKAEIHKDFKREVANGSISEYLTRDIHSEEYIKYVDRWVETCKGGSLDFNDFITLKYTVENVVSPICDGCSSLIMGVAYFTCWDCIVNSSFNDTFDLCSSCYRSKKSEDHNHQNFINNQTMQYLATATLAKEVRNGAVRDEFIGLARTLMGICRSSKTDGLDYPDKLDEISHRLKELQISNAKENSAEEKKFKESFVKPFVREQRRKHDISSFGVEEVFSSHPKPTESDEEKNSGDKYVQRFPRRVDLYGAKATVMNNPELFRD